MLRSLYSLPPEDFLKRYKESKERIENRTADLRRYEEDLHGGRGRNIDGLPKKDNISHPTEAAAFRLAAARERYEKEIAENITICDAIAATVQAIPEPLLERLLTLRYIDGAKWSAVAKDLHYSQAYIEKELKAKALELLQIEMRRKENEQNNSSGETYGTAGEQVPVSN